MRKKIKILATGDLHGDKKAAERLAEKAEKENVDYTIITGDFSFGGTYFDNLIGPFAKRNKKVLLIPGNHETVATVKFLEAKYSNVFNMHDNAIKKDHLGIFGVGSANIGMFQMPEEKIFKSLEKNWKKIKGLEKTIMVTHVHPTGTLMEQFTNFFPGSDAVRFAIEKFQPTIALCSHVHEAHGLEEKIGKTRVINVGKEGKIIEI